MFDTVTVFIENTTYKIRGHPEDDHIFHFNEISVEVDIGKEKTAWAPLNLNACGPEIFEALTDVALEQWQQDEKAGYHV